MTMFHNNRTRWSIALAATVALLGGLSNANAADDEKGDDASNLTPVSTAAQLALQGEARESPASFRAKPERTRRVSPAVRLCRYEGSRPKVALCRSGSYSGPADSDRPVNRDSR